MIPQIGFQAGPCTHRKLVKARGEAREDANAATVAIYAGLGALTFLVAIYVQQVARYSAAEAGLTLMPVTVMLVAGSGP